MKKIGIVLAIILCVFSSTVVLATNTKQTKTTYNNQVVQSETVNQLVEMKDSEKKTLEDYQKAYGSETYGLTAYILNKVQVLSIPFCFV